MDRMKTKFIIAVTTRLAAAEDSNAKTDLIEELSENLYQRYLDLVASGMTEEAAYASALEDLGDVDELLAYLQANLEAYARYLAGETVYTHCDSVEELLEVLAQEE